MKKLLLLIILVPAIAAASDWRSRSTITSVIEDNMCIPDITGQGYLHVDEDVASLTIEVVGADGQQIALYDAGTEIEDVAAPGTGAYSAPSASNVRVSPSGNSIDCTEMQFADAVYSGQDWIAIHVSDGKNTIMDFTRYVDLREGEVISLANDSITAAVIANDAIGVGEIAPDAIGESELAENAITQDQLSFSAIDEIWEEVVEDQGSTYTAREVMSLLLAEAMGTCTYTSNTLTWVCQDPSGTETRFTLVYGSALDGDRTSSTPAPVTP